MAFTSLSNNLNIVQGLGDRPNALDGLSAAQLKAKFDEASNIIKNYINTVLIAELSAVTDSDSGADNIGSTAINDLDGATVQAILESLRNKLKSVTDGSSGADFVGATAISGLTGETVQAVLEALKIYIDTNGSDQSGALNTHKSSGDHDGRYYTETEIDANFVSKSNLENVRRLSAAGDFTGSWFGVTNPAQSDPGIAGLVELHTEQLAAITYYSKSFGIVGDGVTDDYAAIQAMFNSIPDNSSVMFERGKTYLLGDGSSKQNEILLENRRGITIFGNGATLRQNPNNPGTADYAGNTLSLNLSSNIAIYNLTIEGSSATRTPVGLQIAEKGNGIRVNASNNVLIKDCNFNYNLIDGILVGGAYNGNDCNNIQLLNCNCDYNGRQGISVAEATNVLIDGGVMSNTGVVKGDAPMAGIDIEPNGYTDAYIDEFAPTGTGSNKIQRKHENVTIRNVKFINNLGGDLRIQYYYPKNVYVDKCTLNRVFVLQSENVTITNSKINIFSLWNSNKNLSIRKNSINEDNVTFEYVVAIEGCDGIHFEENEFKNAANLTGSLIKMTGTQVIATSPQNVSFVNNDFCELKYTSLNTTRSFLHLIDGFDNISFRNNTIRGNATINMLNQLVHIQYVNANTDCGKRISFKGNDVDCKNTVFIRGNNAGIIKLEDNDLRNCRYIAYGDAVAADLGPYNDFIMHNNKLYLNNESKTTRPRGIFMDLENYKLDISDNIFFNTDSATALTDTSYFSFIQCTGYVVDNIIQNGCVVPYIINPFTSVVTFIRNTFSTKAIDFATPNSVVSIQNYKLNGTVNTLTSNNRGSTGSRPTSVAIGFMYYDTTLSKPVWWDGTNWKDSAGTTV